MSDPDLATSITKPEVMQAIAECTSNPMAILKYQSNAEVSRDESSRWASCNGHFVV